MASINKIAPCLWFNTEAEEAARFYSGIFKNSRVGTVTRYPESSHPAHKDRAGTAMVVQFELEGQKFTALNGGPQFTFNEAVSFQVACENQQEVDDFWARLVDGGDPRAQQCGWLKDKFGVSWQVVPRALTELLANGDAAKGQKVMNAMLQMKKIDIAALQRAAE